MDFEYDCWRCGTTCVVYGRPVGFWVERYRLPGEWECWNCGATNTTPDDE
ncbi:hypothetical protein [Streptomyces sp. NBC_01618]|nr:hypothetical protein OH735_08505 [Streptomyces sp. NBC_01618]